jgi:hypothetical protein
MNPPHNTRVASPRRYVAPTDSILRSLQRRILSLLHLAWIIIIVRLSDPRSTPTTALCREALPRRDVSCVWRIARRRSAHRARVCDATRRDTRAWEFLCHRVTSVAVAFARGAARASDRISHLAFARNIREPRGASGGLKRFDSRARRRRRRRWRR